MNFVSDSVQSANLVWGSSAASPNLVILGAWIDNKLTFEAHWISCLEENLYLKVGEERFDDTSGLLRCYYAFVFQILHHSHVWGSASGCHFSFLSARCIVWPGFVLICFLYTFGPSTSGGWVVYVEQGLLQLDVLFEWWAGRSALCFS